LASTLNFHKGSLSSVTSFWATCNWKSSYIVLYRLYTVPSESVSCVVCVCVCESIYQERQIMLGTKFGEIVCEKSVSLSLSLSLFSISQSNSLYLSH
jgi:hypothetical protein